ncbi:NPH3 family [Musa troglodytarum]|uniref:NPH3 family n=1 Tax=Musa troglodytarum TaxID=320322 RepID=A0A9E7GGH9_9LILI|nr:NPH3 family [Musa troglodytarum]
MSVSFLSMLLRAAIYLETTVACRLDLEKRMGLQLGQAVIDDLLIPSFAFDGETMFDVDTVQRILMNYLEHEVNGTRIGYSTDDDYISPPHGDMERVGRLMESYLAEIASDPNLTISRFISLGEMVSEQARVNEDGMYRAVDIYLKAHPSLTDEERKKVCSLMDCQKLSRRLVLMRLRMKGFRCRRWFRFFSTSSSASEMQRAEASRGRISCSVAQVDSMFDETSRRHGRTLAPAKGER